VREGFTVREGLGDGAVEVLLITFQTSLLPTFTHRSSLADFETVFPILEQVAPAFTALFAEYPEKTNEKRSAATKTLENRKNYLTLC